MFLVAIVRQYGMINVLSKCFVLIFQNFLWHRQLNGKNVWASLKLDYIIYYLHGNWNGTNLDSWFLIGQAGYVDTLIFFTAQAYYKIQILQDIKTAFIFEE